MEIIINNKTYTLRSVNSERRSQFIKEVLSIYDYNSSNFDDFILETQKQLKRNHNITMPLDKVRVNFFKQYSRILQNSIWSFLDPLDKKDIGVANNINVTKEESVKFIEYVCSKIKEYSSYVASNNSKSTSEDIHLIYSYLARENGWTLEYMKEMDELDLLKSLEKAIELKEKEDLANINSQALSSAYAAGNKSAKTQVESLNRKLKTKEKVKEMKKKGMSADNSLSRSQIESIMRAKNG